MSDARSDRPSVSWYEEGQHRGMSAEERERGLVEVADLLRELQPQAWLDFGCCDGALQRIAQDVGAGYGYDIDEPALAEARRHGLTVFSDWSGVPAVDCIVAADVVEHMAAEPLIDWLHRWHDKLSPAGTLVVKTLNPGSLAAMNSFWDDWSHVRPYGEASISALAAMAGFKRQRVLWLPRRTFGRAVSRYVTKKLIPALRGASDFITYVALYAKSA